MQIGLIAASPFVLDVLEHWVADAGLALVEKSGLLVKAEGEMEAIARALEVRFHDVEQGWHTDDRPTLPPGGVAVSGLSTSGTLKPHGKIIDQPLPGQTMNNAYGITPDQVSHAYQVSGTYDGTGQTIGIAEWGCSWQQADIDGFNQAQNLPAVSPTIVSVDGYVNTFNPADGPEATLDIEWAHGMAPGADIRVYMAPAGTTEAAFALEVTHLLNTVLTDSVIPSVLSISYGDGEDQFHPSDLAAWDHLISQITAKGTTVLVSSGDTGAYALHAYQSPQIRRVAAPASCPAAVAVGGTALFMDMNTVEDEWGWSNDLNFGASTGGYSDVFTAPSYQAHLSPKPSQRGVPDLAAVAAVDTMGYLYYNGGPTMMAGTSWAAPIVAGILTRINHARASHKLAPVGDIHATLYAHGGTLCKDITVGNNTCFAVAGYDCRDGWDEVTGWGSPIYPAWEQIFVTDALPSTSSQPTSRGSQPSGTSVDPSTLTVAELDAAPNGHYGADLIPLQAAARYVTFIAKNAGDDQGALFMLSHRPWAYWTGAMAAADKLWNAGVRK